jgi:hypothetical protein
VDPFLKYVVLALQTMLDIELDQYRNDCIRVRLNLDTPPTRLLQHVWVCVGGGERGDEREREEKGADQGC